MQPYQRELLRLNELNGPGMFTHNYGFNWCIRLSGLVHAEIKRMREVIMRKPGFDIDGLLTFKDADQIVIPRLIRNMQAHWFKISNAIRRELCPSLENPTSANCLADEYLKYWTLKYPALLVACYVVVNRNKICGLRDWLVMSDLEHTLTVSSTKNEKESLGDEPIFFEDESSREIFKMESRLADILTDELEQDL